MAVMHRALLAWFLCLIFLILLVIRLDQRTTWNWFVVFIPIWVLDFVVLIHSIFSIIHIYKIELCFRVCSRALFWKIYTVVTVILTMVTQVLLCLKLSSWNVPLYAVFLPLWIMLVVGLVRMTIILCFPTTGSAVSSLFNLLIIDAFSRRSVPVAAPIVRALYHFLSKFNAMTLISDCLPRFQC